MRSGSPSKFIAGSPTIAQRPCASYFVKLRRIVGPDRKTVSLRRSGVIVVRGPPCRVEVERVLERAFKLAESGLAGSADPQRGEMARTCQRAGDLAAPNPDLVQRGALLFLSPDLSGDGSRSCDTCHPGGESDGRVYRQGVEAPAGSPGARDVPMLRGLWQTPPYLWDGSISSLREVISRMLEIEMNSGRMEEPDLAALEAYLLSIPPFDRGRIEPDGTPIEPVTLSARRGFGFFKQAKCVECHPPPVFARRRRFDVGTGMQLQPPSLRGVASSAPYSHDGRWSTLGEAVRAMLAARGIDYTERELTQLIGYLQLL
jgi:cytochrome c peroxidase